MSGGSMYSIFPRLESLGVKRKRRRKEEEKVQLPSLASFKPNQNEGIGMQTSDEEAHPPLPPPSS